jgi:hypothetical protein
MRAFASPAEFEPLSSYHEYPRAEMEARSRAFAADMQRRRTTRQFSNRPVRPTPGHHASPDRISP